MCGKVAGWGSHKLLDKHSRSKTRLAFLRTASKARGFPAAKAVKRGTRMRVKALGGIASAQQMAEIVLSTSSFFLNPFLCLRNKSNPEPVVPGHYRHPVRFRHTRPLGRRGDKDPERC